jgi:hypothetical protein
MQINVEGEHLRGEGIIHKELLYVNLTLFKHYTQGIHIQGQQFQ